MSSPCPREDLGLLDRLARVDPAALADAGASLRVVPGVLRLMSKEPRLLGRVVTALADDDLVPVLAGLEAAGPGDVLVVSANGSPNAVAGELFAGEAARRGLSGLVVDGLMRDSRSIAAMDLPIYARGTSPRAAGARSVPTVNVPLNIADVPVRPGDIIAGDQDGMVVASEEELRAGILAAESIQFRDEALASAMDQGVSLFEKLNFTDHVRRLQDGEDSRLEFLT